MRYRVLISIFLTFSGLLACQVAGARPTDEISDPTLYQAPTPTIETSNGPDASLTPTEAEIVSTAFPVTETTDKYGIPMMLVPAGDFVMGTDMAHTVFLDAYYIDKYEVTNTYYKSCVSTSVCEPPKESSSNSHDDYFENSEFNAFPVIYVDWNMAKKYCEWRGARLPTEAEWEKAARGTDQRLYPWGESINCRQANYLQCQNGDTTAVGTYVAAASPYGLYDTSGNVFEWVADWYSETYYQDSPAANPTGPELGELRVMRGGSWEFFDSGATTINRAGVDPAYSSKSLGFRCARTS